MTIPYAAISDADERELVTALAWAAATRAAPEELPFFVETSQEYWDDPRAALEPARDGEAVGFGLDAAMLTPILLAISTPVVRYLAVQFGDAVRDRAGPRVAAVLRRLFGLGRPGETINAASLSTEQVSTVRQVARQQAVALGIPAARAELLADAIVGGTLAVQNSG